MKHQIKSIARTFGLSAAISFSLASCMTTLAPGVSNIPGVGYSLLDRANADLRRSLMVAPSPLPRDATYLPFSCSFRADVNAMDRGASTTQPRVTATRARDRLLFTINEGANVSTALTSPGGHLFDFNLTGFLGGQRMDAGTYGQQARAAAERLEASGQRGNRVLNEFSMVFPEFTTRRPAPGDVVSVLMDQFNKEWGRYVYRGLARYGTGEVGVLDLMTTASDGNTPVSVGFTLVDPANLTPILMVFNAGSNLRFERLACP